MKKVIVSLLAVLGVFALAFYASASSLEAHKKTELYSSLSDSIFLGDTHLKKTVLAYKSGIDLSQHNLKSNCSHLSGFLGTKENLFFFEISFEASCTNKQVFLERDGVILYPSFHKLKFYSPYDIYNKFTDYSSIDLQSVLADLAKKKQTLQNYSHFDSSDASNFLSLQKIRKYREVTYLHEIIHKILESREYAYLIPIEGYSLPTQKAHMPNFSRAYRKGYTDGIHHGWDIFAPNETPVQALDHGIIVRTVRGFQFEDLGNIVRASNLTEMQKLRNLDVHRGNQVWLKTMKGEIVLYSHLEDVYDDIEEGMFVSKGTKLGTTGITGVPERGYTDYHLHFAIHKNPYNSFKAGKYSIDEYMTWDWLLKGLDMNDVKVKQQEIFVQK